MTNRFGGGDRDERFQSLYRRYYWRIVAFYERGFRLSKEEAEELTQETFIRVYEAIDEYRGDAEYAYLESAARNVGLNKIRWRNTKKRNVKTVDIDDPTAVGREPAAPEGPDYAEREEAARRQKRLFDAIAALPATQRDCLLQWLGGSKYEEIARAMGITTDAVKSRLRDAKRILRERVGEGAAVLEDEP